MDIAHWSGPNCPHFINRQGNYFYVNFLFVTIKNFFSNQFKSSKCVTTFCPKSEKLVFKCPLLIYLHFFCLLFSGCACLTTVHILSLISNSKHNRRSHVKLHNILFFLFFKKAFRKMSCCGRWNEMRIFETLCWIIRDENHFLDEWHENP